ncbi:MAG: argininosuccinate lyase [Spirochaetaceae bacterium]|jgi:argininosuccinate lyase|nr:argininosuccinate lyase [Spirochaetaceae bacterium]
MNDTNTKPDVLWAGRLEKKPQAEAFEFQASLRIDKRMAAEDITGSRAHAAMLGRQGIIPEETARLLDTELAHIAREIEDGSLQIDEGAEDIHSFVESVLTARLGNEGRTIHAGRSRNDQTAVDFRLYCKKAVLRIDAELGRVLNALLDAAETHAESIMPGYTHLQRAQPVTLGFHLCAWACALTRDKSRFADALRRLDESPLGAGALAGSTLNIDRPQTAKALGFARPTLNAMDSVAARDFAIELAASCAIAQSNLSRFCEDIVLWASEEFKFIDLAEEWSTGSSIMPQKKNPDFAELIRGKAGRTVGNLVTLLSMVKGLPYAYNKDLQEDKEALFDSFDTLETCLRMFAGMIASARFNTGRMRAACGGGFLEATDCAEYLVTKGLPFRKAHELSAVIVRDCIAKGLPGIASMGLKTLKTYSPLIGDDIIEKLSPESCVSSRSSFGGTAPAEVRRQIAALQTAAAASLAIMRS